MGIADNNGLGIECLHRRINVLYKGLFGWNTLVLLIAFTDIFSRCETFICIVVWLSRFLLLFHAWIVKMMEFFRKGGIWAWDPFTFMNFSSLVTAFDIPFWSEDFVHISVGFASFLLWMHTRTAVDCLPLNVTEFFRKVVISFHLDDCLRHLFPMWGFYLYCCVASLIPPSVSCLDC